MKKKNNKLITVFVIFLLIIFFFFYFNSDFSKSDYSQETPISTDTIKQELLAAINPDNDPEITVEVKKAEGDFALITIGEKQGGYVSIWKKDNNLWQQILSTQDQWECEVVISENIPPALVDNSCFYYATQQAGSYNQATGQWEK
jgi:hypothetical protein